MADGRHVGVNGSVNGGVNGSVKRGDTDTAAVTSLGRASGRSQVTRWHLIGYKAMGSTGVIKCMGL